MTAPQVWTITFDQPTALLSMNDRDNWRADRKLAKRWRCEAMQAAMVQVAGLSLNRAAEMVARLHVYKQKSQHPARLQLLGVAPITPCTVQVMLPVATVRARDPHNYFKTVKPIVDGLVDAGLWPDDTPEWVTTVEPRLVVKAPKVVITLTERGAQ